MPNHVVDYFGRQYRFANACPPRSFAFAALSSGAPGATHTTHASAKPDETVSLLAIIIGPKDAPTTSPVR